MIIISYYINHYPKDQRLLRKELVSVGQWIGMSLYDEGLLIVNVKNPETAGWIAVPVS